MRSLMMDLLRFSFLRKRKIFDPHFNMPANPIGCEILPIYFRLLHVNLRPYFVAHVSDTSYLILRVLIKCLNDK